MPCIRCGASLAESARFCSECGFAALRRQEPTARDVLRLKHISRKEWDRIAKAFRAAHRRNSLLPWASWLTFNTAWDNYFLGYNDGLDAGVSRALGLSEIDLAHINEFADEPELD